jgi:hypothetical protein
MDNHFEKISRRYNDAPPPQAGCSMNPRHRGAMGILTMVMLNISILVFENRCLQWRAVMLMWMQQSEQLAHVRKYFNWRLFLCLVSLRKVI